MGSYGNRVFFSKRHAELPAVSPLIDLPDQEPVIQMSEYDQRWVAKLTAEADRPTLAVPRPHRFDRNLVVGPKKRHADSNLSSCHSSDTLLSMTRDIVRFGGHANEIEYSASLKFPRQVRVAPGSLVYWNRRRYYKTDRYVAADGAAVTTDPFLLDSGSRRRVVLRVDDRAPGTHTSRPWVTAKLKLFTDRLLLDGCCRVNLTASIETLMADASPFVAARTPVSCARPQERYVSRRFCYWRLQLVHGGRLYSFRVAFRQNEVRGEASRPLERCGFCPTRPVEMNVECEEPITRLAFVDLFHALSVYYPYMWDSGNEHGLIEPVMPADLWAQFVSSQDTLDTLSQDQIDSLSQLRVAPWVEDGDGQLCDGLVQFVKLLGCQSYVDVVGAMISVSDTFDLVRYSNARVGAESGGATEESEDTSGRRDEDETSAAPTTVTVRV